MHCPRITFILLAAATLTACGGDSTDDNNATQAELEIDASSYTDYVYYDIDGNSATQVDVVDPATSSDWDIGFRRTSIVLNGGVSGPGSVEGALAATPAGAYDMSDEPVVSVLTNDISGLAADTFAAVTSADGLSFIADSHAAAVDGWYNYDFMTHTVSAADDKYWIIRSGAGDSYAIMRVKSLTQSGYFMSAITLGLAVQGSADSSFASEAEYTINFSGTDVACFDIDLATPATVDCAGDSWDLYLDPSFEIYLNSGIEGGGSGAAFGDLTLAETGDFSNGAAVPHWTPDAGAGVFSENSWYAYNLLGGHKLWANGRVYVLSDGVSQYKFQILSYYDEGGASGHLLVRVAQLP